MELTDHATSPSQRQFLSNKTITAFPNLTLHFHSETIGRFLKCQVMDKPKGTKPWDMLRDQVETYIKDVDTFVGKRLREWRQAISEE